jgi:hypothetical protein
MPALNNPRWERFAQLIVQGLIDGDRKAYSQGRAYIAAGYTAKDQGKRGGSAEAAASRLLNRVKPILDRIRELQAEALARIQPKLDISRERVGRNLDLASQIARGQGNAQAIVASELGIAKVFGLIGASDDHNPTDPSKADSMQDIGRMLLQSVGFSAPDDASISLAIEANDAFVARLEEIRAAADSTIDEDD